MQNASASDLPIDASRERLDQGPASAAPVTADRQLRDAQPADAAAIAAIYNQGIAERSSTFETRLRSAEDILEWLAQAPRYPLLLAEQQGQVLGWANLSQYRPRACYAGNAEFSIYLDRSARGRGIGRQLLNALLQRARELGYSKLISRIFPDNQASLALCRSVGFREVGLYRNHAQLDGEWRDVVIVERWLLDPAGIAAAAAPSLSHDT